MIYIINDGHAACQPAGGPAIFRETCVTVMKFENDVAMQVALLVISSELTCIATNHDRENNLDHDEEGTCYSE